MKQIAIIMFLESAIGSTLLFAASIAGRVLDPSGAAVAGVQVRLIKEDDSRDWSSSSSTDGRYEFSSLLPSRYELQVMAPGFAFFRRPLFLNSENEALAFDATLRLGEIQERMTVKAVGTPKPTVATQPTRIRVGGNVQASKIVHKVNPEYPAEAKLERRQGTVTFRAIIGRDGSIIDLVTLNAAHSILAEAAESAVRQWKYRPTLLNGNPVEVITAIDINFTLN